MKWLFRPSLLVLLMVVLAVGGAVLVLWPRSTEIRAAPLKDDESEIVWLYPATNESSWERFVTAIGQSAERLRATYPDLQVSQGENAFPRQTSGHPELSMTVRHGSAKLVFRWYKLTSDQKTDQWVSALMDGSRRPPLAIIGGISSDHAKEIALSLRQHAGTPPRDNAPLLLLTTATADRVPVPDQSDDVKLNDLYRDRTFRFCFTNQRMAETVTAFVAGRDTLRPDSGPFYTAEWLDDTYSHDLITRFSNAVATRFDPPGGDDTFQFPVFRQIPYSVGGFDLPNRREAQEAEWLMETKIKEHPQQARPLLVLAAPAAQPARRFLRGMARFAPGEARRFVVVTGDTLSFSTIYRDRKVAWPIQDLPFQVVFFCHRNPIDAAAGFLREDTANAGATAPGTGTEDLLLYMDIVETLAQAANQGQAMPANGAELAERLRRARWHEDRVAFDTERPTLFTANGNRSDGTGEHIVWLRPDVEKADPKIGMKTRVSAKARIRVFASQGTGDGRVWSELPELVVDYD